MMTHGRAGGQTGRSAAAHAAYERLAPLKARAPEHDKPQQALAQRVTRERQRAAVESGTLVDAQ